MDDDWGDEELRLVSVTAEQLAAAQAQVESCEACDPESEIPFDWLLREVVSNQGYVDYILPTPAKCPKCRAEIHEGTLTNPDRVGTP